MDIKNRKTILHISFTLVAILFLNAPLAVSKAQANSLYNTKLIQHRYNSAQTLLEIGEEYSFISWNIQKAKEKTKFYNELKNLTDTIDVDILHLQEAPIEKKLLHFIDSSDLKWITASNRQSLSGIKSGVSTGSRFELLTAIALKSSGKEPIVRTPKISLFCYLKIKNSNQTLLIVNIHALNFVYLSSFKKQILQVITQIAKHDGPILLGGDLNTWNQERKTYLTKVGKKVFLTKNTPTHKGPYGLELDQIYTRGLEVTQSMSLSNMKSSDHPPLLVRFKLN